MSLHTRLARRRYKTVTLSDGEQVRLRSLLRSEQRQWKAATREPAAEQYSDDVLIALCVVDGDGNQLISCDDALTGFFDHWDMADCQLLLRAALDLNYTEPITKAAVEASLKNSKPTTGSDSCGDSAIATDVPSTICMIGSVTGT